MRLLHGTRSRTWLAFALLALCAAPVCAAPAFAATGDPPQQTPDLEARVDTLEADLERLEEAVDSLPIGLILLLFGGFCALWAQNTGRSAWLWFFLGLFFNVFAMVVMLAKNPGKRDAA